jgi:DNA-binding beta-propeller fold protein YncE
MRTRSFVAAPTRFVFALVALTCLIGAPAALAAPVMAPVAGSPFPTGSVSDPISVAFSPSGGLLVAANDNENTVSVFSVSAAGALAPLAGSPVATGQTPSSAAFSPDGRWLGVANFADNSVSVYGVSAAGALTPVAGSPFATGTGPFTVAFSASSGQLATANSGSGNVSVFSVSAAGVLAPVGGSPFATGNTPVSVAFGAGGRLAATNLLSNTVSMFSVSAANVVTPVAGSPFATGLTPAGVAFNAAGSQLAIANSGAGNVSVFSVSAAGALAQVTGSPFAAGPSPGSVAFRPGGGLIVAGDSSDGTVGVFLLSPAGFLTPAEGSPVTTGSILFPVAFSPGGGLFATSSHNADTGAGSVSVYSVTLPATVPDTTAPTVTCGTASTQWLAANASINCRATDTGSGLANPAQASFNLTTNVAAGAESANASTNSVQVCDVTGNCRAAGPIAGNRIDRKAPAVTLTRPANGASYSSIGTLLAPVRAAFSCADTGSGITSCAGTQANGSTVPTSLLALGAHSFSVTARDLAGNTTTVRNTYSVRLL